MVKKIIFVLGLFLFMQNILFNIVCENKNILLEILVSAVVTGSGTFNKMSER